MLQVIKLFIWLFYQMHVEQQRQIMMRERQQKQAAAVALAASSAASRAPSSVDASKTPSAVPTSATPGSSQQQQGNKRHLALTVGTNMCHWLGGHLTKKH